VMAEPGEDVEHRGKECEPGKRERHVHDRPQQGTGPQARIVHICTRARLDNTRRLAVTRHRRMTRLASGSDMRLLGLDHTRRFDGSVALDAITLEVAVGSARWRCLFPGGSPRPTARLELDAS
jgi:hypothetical protein